MERALGDELLWADCFVRSVKVFAASRRRGRYVENEPWRTCACDRCFGTVELA